MKQEVAGRASPGPFLALLVHLLPKRQCFFREISDKICARRSTFPFLKRSNKWVRLVAEISTCQQQVPTMQPISTRRS